MRKILILMFTVLLAGSLTGCFGGDKKIDPAKAEELKKVIVGTEAPTKMEAMSPAVTYEPQTSEPTHKPAGVSPELMINEDVMPFAKKMLISDASRFAHMYNLEAGDIYFTIILDDGTHYICTTIQEVLGIATLMDYNGRSGDIVTKDFADEYLNELIWRGGEPIGIAQDKWDASLRVLNKHLRYRAYDVYGVYNQIRNWESKGI